MYGIAKIIEEDNKKLVLELQEKFQKEKYFKNY